MEQRAGRFKPSGPVVWSKGRGRFKPSGPVVWSKGRGRCKPSGPVVWSKGRGRFKPSGSVVWSKGRGRFKPSGPVVWSKGRGRCKPSGPIVWSKGRGRFKTPRKERVFCLTKASTQFIYEHMVNTHSDSKRGNPLLPLPGLFLPISREGYFIYTIPETGVHIP